MKQKLRNAKSDYLMLYYHIEIPKDTAVILYKFYSNPWLEWKLFLSVNDTCSDHTYNSDQHYRAPAVSFLYYLTCVLLFLNSRKRSANFFYSSGSEQSLKRSFQRMFLNERSSYFLKRRGLICYSQYEAYFSEIASASFWAYIKFLPTLHQIKTRI